MTRILEEKPDLVLWVEWMPAYMRNAGYDPTERLRSLGFGRIEALDDHQTTRAVDEFLPLVRSFGPPAEWRLTLLRGRS
jgi:hypothetical protein